MATRILREALLVLIGAVVIVLIVAIWGVPGERQQPASAEAAVSFEESLELSAGQPVHGAGRETAAF